MTNNPFETLESKLNNIETLLTKVLTQQQTQSSPQQDVIGGIELAEKVTGLKKATIYCHISKNKIPHFKRGGRVYFSKETLQKWMTENARGSPIENNSLPKVLFPRQRKKII